MLVWPAIQVKRNGGAEPPRASLIEQSSSMTWDTRPGYQRYIRDDIDGYGSQVRVEKAAYRAARAEAILKSDAAGFD